MSKPNSIVMWRNPFIIPVLVTIERRSHLFPSRTQKLSFSSSKILDWRRSGKIEHCQCTYETPERVFFLCLFAMFYLRHFIKWRASIRLLSGHPEITHFASLKFRSPSKILPARSQAHCQCTYKTPKRVFFHFCI